jgi:hypothetical protein
VKKTLILLGVGCVLVGVVGVVMLIIGGDFKVFAIVNGALAVLLLVLFRGSVTGADENRPPGVARVSAARWAGPTDPDKLAAQERALQPDNEAAAEARAEEPSTGFGFLLAAVPPAAAAIICVLTVL